MATMYEIYEKHACEYDQLVEKEDYSKNLPRVLNEVCDFTGKKVLEFGAGTGRLTAMYGNKAREIHCFDRSQHMLDKACINLKNLGDKVRYSLCDNNEIGELQEQGDVVIEGWSFGHTVSDDPEILEEKVDQLVAHVSKLLRPGGIIIFIETLGTYVDAPNAPTEHLKIYYHRLESEHQFKRVEISTEYKFDSFEEAAQKCGFFFGAPLGDEIREKKLTIIPEYTGLWYRKI